MSVRYKKKNYNENRAYRIKKNASNNLNKFVSTNNLNNDNSSNIKVNKLRICFSKIYNFIFHLTTARILLLGFGALILIGAILLRLNINLNDGVSLSFLDALFVSTSAISTTGLSTVSIVGTFNTRGIFILLLLMQVGAIGFITFVCFLFSLLGKKLSLKNRTLFEESFDFNGNGRVIDIAYKIICFVFTAEGIGAVLLMFRLIPMYGARWGILYSVFQAVSAFCNSGLDLFGVTSLQIFKGDIYINIILCLLIFLGSIGYLVVFDVLRKIKYTHDHKFSYKKLFSKFTLNTKIILKTSFILIIAGALGIFILESFNKDSFGDLNTVEKILVSIFQSISARSAGITTINVGLFKDYTKLFYIILMLIGGAPASTGGGIKVVTVAVLYLTVRAVMKGDEETITFNRKIPRDTIRKAIVIFFASISIVITSTIILAIAEDFSLVDILFEAVSAFCTCGASCGITASLSVFSKIFIMILMYVGRIGIVTFLMSISTNDSNISNSVEYPEEKIMIIS